MLIAAGQIIRRTAVNLLPERRQATSAVCSFCKRCKRCPSWNYPNPNPDPNQVTYLQIYNEALYDMLAEEGGGAPAELLRIRQDPQRGV